MEGGHRLAAGRSHGQYHFDCLRGGNASEPLPEAYATG